MVLVSIVSTAATFCCFAVGWASGSLDRFRFPWATADTFIRKKILHPEPAYASLSELAPARDFYS